MRTIPTAARSVRGFGLFLVVLVLIPILLVLLWSVSSLTSGARRSMRTFLRMREVQGVARTALDEASRSSTVADALSRIVGGQELETFLADGVSRGDVTVGGVEPFQGTPYYSFGDRYAVEVDPQVTRACAARSRGLEIGKVTVKLLLFTDQGNFGLIQLRVRVSLADGQGRTSRTVSSHRLFTVSGTKGRQETLSVKVAREDYHHEIEEGEAL